MSIDNAAKTPEQICDLFRRAMAQGDLEAVLAVYDEEAVFLDRDGALTRGRDDLRRQLAPLVAARARFDYSVRQVVETAGSRRRSRASGSFSFRSPSPA